MSDFEDALLVECAKRVSVDYIITRNKKDFKQSPVKAMEPGEFIKLVSQTPPKNLQPSS